MSCHLVELSFLNYFIKVRSLAMGPASPSNMNGNVTRAEVMKKHHSAHL